MAKTVFLFPGQGSQHTGMGQVLYQSFAFVRDIFDMASEISGRNLAALCFDGPDSALKETAVLQPAVTAVNLACLAVVAKEGVTPFCTAGHSLGEYSALASAGVLNFRDTLTLVTRRGELMGQAADAHTGGMVAVIGLSIETVQDIIAAIDNNPGVITVANYNTDKQIAVSGDVDSLQRFSEKVREKKGRAIPLKVSGAWHSRLMADAQHAFAGLLDTVTLNQPECPVVLNVSADFADTIQVIHKTMAVQICSPVLWYPAMMNCIAQGADTFVELGPGHVLTGLLKKIIPDAVKENVYNVHDMSSLTTFLNKVN